MTALTCLHDTGSGPRLLSDVQTIGGNIRRLMERENVATQAELAARLRVSQPQASDWINDRYEWKDAKIWTLVKIAVALNASVDELLVDTEIGRDLIRHTPEYQSMPTKEGVDADVVATLRQQISVLEGALGTVMADFKAAIDKVASGQRKSKQRRHR